MPRSAYPTESQEQRALIAWARLQRSEARLIFAIPNGGLRTKTTGARLKLEGVMPGVPDLFLPVPMEGAAGLFIELKSIHGGKMTGAQIMMASVLRDQGYEVAICRGWDEAREVVLRYLGSPKGPRQRNSTCYMPG